MLKILIKINKTLHFWDRRRPCPQAKNRMKTCSDEPNRQNFSQHLVCQILGW
jgi:hypothetical protein